MTLRSRLVGAVQGRRDGRSTRWHGDPGSAAQPGSDQHQVAATSAVLGWLTSRGRSGWVPQPSIRLVGSRWVDTPIGCSRIIHGEPGPAPYPAFDDLSDGRLTSPPPAFRQMVRRGHRVGSWLLHLQVTKYDLSLEKALFIAPRE